VRSDDVDAQAGERKGGDTEFDAQMAMFIYLGVGLFMIGSLVTAVKCCLHRNSFTCEYSNLNHSLNMVCCVWC
jgi:hypothetical protein